MCCFYYTYTVYIYVLWLTQARNIDKMQRVQNRAARLVSGIRSDHVTPVMKDLHWLPIGACIDLKILLLTFKILNDLAPYYLTSLLLKYQPARLLHSPNRLLLQVPSVNTVAYGDHSFSYYALIIWNSLPDHIKNSESVSSFKQRLKTFLFRKNYYREFHLDFIYYFKRFEDSLKLCTIKLYYYYFIIIIT